MGDQATGWTFTEDNQVYLFSNVDNTNQLVLIPPELVNESLGPTAKTNPTALLTDIFAQLYHVDLDAELVTPARTGNGRGMALTWLDVEYPEYTMAVVIKVEDSLYAYAEISVFEGNEPSQEMLTMMEMLVSFRPLGDDLVGMVIGETGVACEVRAVGDDVALRDGPAGSVFTTMPANTYIPTWGKNETEGGNLWWLVDFEATLNGLWVADEDVIMRGDCLLVDEIDPENVRISSADFEGLVACLVQNASAFTVTGEMIDEQGTELSFEITANNVIAVMVAPGTYNVHYYCNSCGEAAQDAVWDCDGRTVYQLHIP